MAVRSLPFWFFVMFMLPVTGYVLIIVASNAALRDSPRQADKEFIKFIRILYAGVFGGMANLGFMHCLLYAAGFRSTGIAKRSLASGLMSVVSGRIGARSPYSRLQSAGVSGMGSLTCLFHAVIGACLGGWLSARLL